MTNSEKRWLWVIKFIYKRDVTKLISEAKGGLKRARKMNNLRLIYTLTDEIYLLQSIQNKLQLGTLNLKDIKLNDPDEEYEYINEEQYFKDIK